MGNRFAFFYTFLWRAILRAVALVLVWATNPIAARKANIARTVGTGAQPASLHQTIR